MSDLENTRITDAIAKNVGIRYCSNCMRTKPAEGFVKVNSRWRCPACTAISKQIRGMRS